MRRKSNFTISCLVMLFMIALLIGTVTAQEQVLTETKGPQGEEPTWYSEVKLTPEEIQKVKEGNYKAAYLMHTSSDFTNALMALSLIHISEPTRLLSISSAVFCLKKKNTK